MRLLRIMFSLVLTLVFCSTLSAQHAPQKDAQAVAVLARMLGATGWNALATPRDVVSTGIVTRYIADSQDTIGITLKVKGLRHYRTEVTESSGVTTTIVNGERAAVLAPRGTRTISTQAAITMRPVAFPFLSDLVSLADGQIAVRFLGSETLQGELTYRIEIDREPSSPGPSADVHRRADHLTAWISASSWLLVQIEYVRLSNDNSFAALHRVRSFSDYRVVNGLAIPFRQVESVRGRVLYTLQLTEVRFNTGLSDAEFTLPGGQE